MILVLFTSSDSACAHKIQALLTAKEEKVQLLSIKDLDMSQILQRIID